jgi:hypothetical protein
MYSKNFIDGAEGLRYISTEYVEEKTHSAERGRERQSNEPRHFCRPGVIRDNAPHDGAIATAATTVTRGLESPSTYLKEKDYENLATDLTALVRSYPVQALLVGVGLGYLLARSTKG